MREVLRVAETSNAQHRMKMESTSPRPSPHSCVVRRGRKSNIEHRVEKREVRLITSAATI